MYMPKQAGVRPDPPAAPPRLHPSATPLLTATPQLALQRYQRVIAQWPTDKLRPGTQLQDVVKRHTDKTFVEGKPAADEAAELRQASALLMLLNDGFKKKVRPQDEPDPCAIAWDWERRIADKFCFLCVVPPAGDAEAKVAADVL